MLLARDQNLSIRSGRALDGWEWHGDELAARAIARLHGAAWVDDPEHADDASAGDEHGTDDHDLVERAD